MSEHAERKVRQYAPEGWWDKLVRERNSYRGALELIAHGKPNDIREKAQERGLEETQVQALTDCYHANYSSALVLAMKTIARRVLE